MPPPAAIGLELFALSALGLCRLVRGKEHGEELFDVAGLSGDQVHEEHEDAHHRDGDRRAHLRLQHGLETEGHHTDGKRAHDDADGVAAEDADVQSHEHGEDVGKQLAHRGQGGVGGVMLAGGGPDHGGKAEDQAGVDIGQDDVFVLTDADVDGRLLVLRQQQALLAGGGHIAVERIHGHSPDEGDQHQGEGGELFDKAYGHQVDAAAAEDQRGDGLVEQGHAQGGDHDRQTAVDIHQRHDHAQHHAHDEAQHAEEQRGAVGTGHGARHDGRHQHDGAAGEVKASVFELEADAHGAGDGDRDIHDQRPPHGKGAEIGLAVGVADDFHDDEHRDREHQRAGDAFEKIHTLIHGSQPPNRIRLAGESLSGI